MKARDGRLLTGNETDGFGALTRGIQVSPKRLRSGPIMNIKVLLPVAFEREDYVLIFHVIGPERRDESDRRPRLQELANCAQTGIICVLQSPQMKILKYGSPKSCVLPLPSGNSQNKCRIVPKKERLWRDPRPFERCGHLHNAWGSFLAFSCTQVDNTGY